MATYAELLQAADDTGLQNKIKVACFVAAETVRTEANNVPNHTERLKWAQQVFAGASDAAVQTAVDAAVNVFAVTP